jgi:hypothetical protein
LTIDSFSNVSAVLAALPSTHVVTRNYRLQDIQLSQLSLRDARGIRARNAVPSGVCSDATL